MKSNLFTGNLLVNDLEIVNPPRFPVEEFLSLRQLKARFSPLSLVSGRIEVRELDIHLRQLTGIRAACGGVNIEQFRESLERREGEENREGGRRREIAIGRLAVKVDHVATVDYSGGAGAQGRRDYPVLFDREFRNVTELLSLAPPLVSHFEETGLSRAADAIFATLLPDWLWLQIHEAMAAEGSSFM